MLRQLFQLLKRAARTLVLLSCALMGTILRIEEYICPTVEVQL